MKIFRDLKVKLTEAEWNAVASAMGAEQAKLQALDTEKTEVLAAFKSRFERHKAEFFKLCEKVNTREETRAVECVERLDYKRFVVELYRMDTGELVDTRPMSAGERQVTLPGVKGGDDEAN